MLQALLIKLDITQQLREPLAIPRDPIVSLTDWHLFPSVVVYRQALDVD